MARHALPRIDHSRTEFGFKRTVCSCPNCTRFCKIMPSYLIPANVDRIRLFLKTDELLMDWAMRFLRASPGAIILAQGNSTAFERWCRPAGRVEVVFSWRPTIGAPFTTSLRMGAHFSTHICDPRKPTGVAGMAFSRSRTRGAKTTVMRGYGSILTVLAFEPCARDRPRTSRTYLAGRSLPPSESALDASA